MSAISTRMPRQLYRIAWAMALCIASACDPCAGVASCSVEPRVALAGQVVNTAGQGVGGILVDVVRSGGGDSLSTVTDAGGFWRIAFPPGMPTTAAVDVVVTNGSISSYRVRVPVTPVDRGGDALVLPQWNAIPAFNDIGEIYVRSSGDVRVANAPVEFRRTGGVELRGNATATSVIQGMTDPSGRVNLFIPRTPDVLANTTGELLGNLTVQLPGGPSTVPVRLLATHVYRPGARILRVAVGPSLEYQGEFLSRARNVPVAGMQVQFTRTGGVPVTVPTFTAVTDANGRFSIRTLPLAAGVLEGTLVFAAPAPSVPETLQVKLPTFDADGGRLFGVFRAGAYFPAFGIVQVGGAGIAGVTVDVTRVSGVDFTPSTFTVVSRDGGAFPLQPVPLALGDAIVDITFRPPAPYAPLTVRGVRITAVGRDEPDRMVGVYELMRAANSSP